MEKESHKLATLSTSTYTSKNKKRSYKHDESINDDIKGIIYLEKKNNSKGNYEKWSGI